MAATSLDLINEGGWNDISLSRSLNSANMSSLKFIEGEAQVLDVKPRVTGETRLGKLDGQVRTVSHVRLVRHREHSTAVGRDLASHVDGSVLSLSAASVRCEVITSQGPVQINLLPDLFPTKPRFGMAFRLEMEERGGILKPVITERSIEARPHVERTLDALMEGF